MRRRPRSCRRPRRGPRPCSAPARSRRSRRSSPSTTSALVIVDHAVSRRSSSATSRRPGTAKVLDRTGLILEIFGERARTREGRLQVELAHLTYQKSRLVRTWTHLERQRGGFGFLGGPGETQIETDRRLIDERIVAHPQGPRGRRAHARRCTARGARRVPLSGRRHRRLHQRRQVDAVQPPHRRRRRRQATRLFATLDPDHARGEAARAGGASSCPTRSASSPTCRRMLVAAFRATLEEVIEADLILHVRDISHRRDATAQARDVEAVLTDLGIDAVSGRGADPRGVEQGRPAEPSRVTERSSAAAGRAAAALVSAVTGEGIDALLAAIDARLGRGCDRRSGDPGARRPARELAVRGNRGCRARGSRHRRGEAKVRVAAEKEERLDAHARRAGAALTALWSKARSPAPRIREHREWRSLHLSSFTRSFPPESSAPWRQACHRCSLAALKRASTAQGIRPSWASVLVRISGFGRSAGQTGHQFLGVEGTVGVLV